MNSLHQTSIHQDSIVTFNPHNQKLHQCPNCNCRDNHHRKSILRKPVSIYTNQDPKQKKSIIQLHGRKKRQRSKIEERKSQQKLRNSSSQSRSSNAQILIPKQSFSIKQIQQKQSFFKQELPFIHSPIGKINNNESKISIQDHLQRRQQNFIKKDSQIEQFKHQFQNINSVISKKTNIKIYQSIRSPINNPIVPSIYNGKTFFSPPSHLFEYNKIKIPQYQQPSMIRFKSSSPPYKQHKNIDLQSKYQNGNLSSNINKLNSLLFKSKISPAQQEPPKPKILFKNRGPHSPRSSQQSAKVYMKTNLQSPIVTYFDSKQQKIVQSKPNEPLIPNENNEIKKKFIDEEEASQIRQPVIVIQNDKQYPVKIQESSAVVTQKQTPKANIYKMRYSEQVKTIRVPKVYREELIFTKQQSDASNQTHNINQYQLNQQLTFVQPNIKHPIQKSLSQNKQDSNKYEFEQIEIPSQMKQQFQKQAIKKIAQKAKYTQESIQLFDSKIQKQTNSQSYQPSQAVSSQDQMTTLGKILYKEQIRNFRVPQRNRSKSSQEKNTKQSKSPKIKNSIFKPVAQASNFDASSSQTIAKQLVHELKLYYDYYSAANVSQQSVEVSSGQSSLQRIYIAKNNGSNV